MLLGVRLKAWLVHDIVLASSRTNKERSMREGSLPKSFNCCPAIQMEVFFTKNMLKRLGFCEVDVRNWWLLLFSLMEEAS